MQSRSDPAEDDLTLLRTLAAQFPNIDWAMAEIARLSAVLTLPKGTIHVISDIHGEDKKLRHVINNASGTLRPLVERLFAERMSAKEFQEFLTLMFYPGRGGRADGADDSIDPHELREFAIRTMRHQFELVRVLSHALQPPPRDGRCFPRNIRICWRRCCMSRPPSAARNSSKRSSMNC